MPKLTELQKLDAVLDILRLYDSYVSFIVIVENHIKTMNLDISNQEVMLILQKLQKDGFGDLLRKPDN
jgi:hypothetical protein